MRSLLYIVTALAVIGLAFWAYHENYQTQAEIAKTEQINHEIGQARARLTVSACGMGLLEPTRSFARPC